MYLHIQDDRTLKELQDDFSQAFPYLKLEFFSRPHKKGEASLGKNKLNPFLQIVAIRSGHRNGAIEISEEQTIQEVEQSLQKEYELPVQIYHFTKAGWIVTDVADIATLKELNEQGKQAAHEIHNVAAQSKNLK
jgi:uncharacterized protein YheU (UPF0270 family)